MSRIQYVLQEFSKSIEKLYYLNLSAFLWFIKKRRILITVFVVFIINKFSVSMFPLFFSLINVYTGSYK